MGELIEQYGSNVRVGSALVVHTDDLRAATNCLWKPNNVDCKLATENSGIMGISKVGNRLVDISSYALDRTGALKNRLT